MRARFTRSIGLPVTDEHTGDILGSISGILPNPDTGVIEGFFVRAPGFSAHEKIFLASVDILHWGLRVVVRHADVLSPVDDRVRLQSLLSDRRPILRQRMITESGRSLGVCRDVQFNTQDFRLEWLFPRRFLRWGIPVPVTQIVEVRPEAIILRDAVLPSKGALDLTKPLIPQMPEAA